jgi:very-short-patch-repair endonuclease
MYKKSIFTIARELRQRMTPAEKLLWQNLRNRALGVNIRRQAPFYFGAFRYVADFYCPAAKLIIEIDGGVHDEEEVKEYDKFREDIFLNEGYRILRFSNEEVMRDLKGVLMAIKNKFNELT